MRSTGRNSTILYLFYVISLVLAAIGKNAVGLRPLYLCFIVTILFISTKTKLRIKFDKCATVLFPLFLSLTTQIAIFNSSANYVASASFGTIQISDLLIIYMLFRVVDKQHIQEHIHNYHLILCFFAFSIISIFYASSIEYALAGINLFIKTFVIFLWYGSLLDEHKKYFVDSFKIAILFQGLLSCTQYVIGGPIGLTFLGEVSTSFRTRIVDGIVEAGTAGTFAHSGRLAIYLAVCLAYMFFCEEKNIRKAIYIVIAFLGMWFASSRMTIIGLALAIVYTVFKNREKLRQKKYFYTFVFILTLIPLFIYLSYRSGKLDMFFNSDILLQTSNRTVHWGIAFSEIMKHPITGYGINNYAAVMSKINSSLFFYTNPVHNVYLLYWFELGIIPVILYVVILLKSIFLFKNIRRLDGVQKGALTILISVIIYNFTGWSMSSAPAVYFVWMAIGLVNKKGEHGI